MNFATRHEWLYGRCSGCGLVAVVGMGFGTFHPLCAPAAPELEEAA